MYMFKFINIYMYMGNARKFYIMKQMEYIYTGPFATAFACIGEMAIKKDLAFACI
jgi:hypothetical protein